MTYTNFTIDYQDLYLMTRDDKKFYSANKTSLSLGAPRYTHGLTGTPQASMSPAIPITTGTLA